MFCRLEEALDDLRRGRFLVLVDAQDREDEGDLIVAAEHITAEKVNLMLREARGMFLFPAPEGHLQQMGLPLIEPRHGDGMTPRFAVPFDARDGVSTGISAADRARSVLQAIRPDATPERFRVPGHILPLAARPGGLHERQGHTEGSVELARLAGLFPAVAMSEVLNAEGEMARGEELKLFASRIGCRIIGVAQIAAAVGASRPD